MSVDLRRAQCQRDVAAVDADVTLTTVVNARRIDGHPKLAGKLGQFATVVHVDAATQRLERQGAVEQTSVEVEVAEAASQLLGNGALARGDWPVDCDNRR